MNYILLSLLFLLPLMSNGKNLDNFKAIHQASEQAKAITIFMDFKACKPRRSIHAYYRPSSMLFVKDHLSFSDNHFTLRNPQFRGKPVLETISYRLNDKGILNINIAILDPRTYKAKVKP